METREKNLFDKILRMRNCSFLMEKVRISYIDVLFPDISNQPVIFFYKNKLHVQESSNKRNYSCIQQSVQDDSLIGSPLEYSFGKDSFNEDLLLVSTKTWPENEKAHVPLSLQDSRTILNLCLENFDELHELGRPLMALCDGKNARRTFLLGTILDKKCFYNLEARYAGIQSLQKAQKMPPDFLQEHLRSLPGVKGSSKKIPDSARVLAQYEISGVKQQLLDEISMANYEGYLRLDLSWNGLSFEPPIKCFDSVLVLEFSLLSKEALVDLKEEISLLDEYLKVLESHSEASGLISSSRNEADVAELLERFLSVEDVLELENGPIDVTLLEDRQDLQSIIEDLPRRQNLDFTDNLWNIVKRSRNYEEMKECILRILAEIQSGFKPQINRNNSSRFGKIVYGQTPLQITESLPLELSIEIGVQKLIGDYVHVLLNGNLLQLQDIKEILGEFQSTVKFDPRRFREKLQLLLKLQLLVTTSVFVQKQLSCSSECLQSIVAFVWRECQKKEEQNVATATATATATSTAIATPKFEDALTKIFHFEIALGNEVKDKIQSPVSLWRLTLSSETDFTQITSTLQFSKIPIFPPNVLLADDTNSEGCEDLNYHTTKSFVTGYRI